MEEPKVVEEVAVQAFDKFIEDMDLDFNVAVMDVEDKTAAEKLKRRVVGAIMRGSLNFNEDNEAVYTPRHKKSKHTEAITFHERTGAHLTAMDRGKKGESAKQMYAIMGAMCEQPPSVFAGLVGPDIKLCEALFSLLMD